MKTDVEKRVREIAEATEWSGDMRVNMTRVVGALRAAVKLLDECQQEVERLRTHTYCAYCGEEFPVDGDASLVSGHIAQCPKHPMRKLEAENARLRAIVDRLPKTADGVPVVPGMRVWRMSHPPERGEVVSSVSGRNVWLASQPGSYRGGEVASSRGAAEAVRGMEEDENGQG